MRVPKILSVFWHTIISDAEASSVGDGLNPSVSQFSAQLDYLAKNYTPISIFEFLDVLEGKRPPHTYGRPPVFLSFDDGFKGVIKYAMPELSNLRIPATFFVLG